jgi:hypothetical protein
MDSSAWPIEARERIARERYSTVTDFARLRG